MKSSSIDGGTQPPEASLESVIERLESAAEGGRLSPKEASEAIRLLRSAHAAPVEEQQTDLVDRREQILRVAAKNFAQLGFHGTNLQLIADEVGVTRPSFYYYFKSKEEILVAISEAAMSRTEKMLERVLSLDLPPKEKLRTFIAEYIKVNLLHEEARVIFRTFHEFSPDAQRDFVRRRTEFDHRLVAFLQEGIYEGAFRSRAPQVTLFAILGAINGMHDWYRTDGNLSVDEITTVFIDLFCHGLDVTP
jgi:AcrR family transcriptional regulator